MLILISSLISVLGTVLIIYYTEFQKTGNILGWTIPLYFLGLAIGFIIFYILCIGIYTIFIDRKHKVVIPRKGLSFFTYVCCQFVISVFRLQVIVEGSDKLPVDGKFLFVCNHQSMLDPIITIGVFPQFIMTFIMKEQIMKLPIIGNWLYAAGFLPINRDNNRKAIETIILSTQRVEAGYPICVYPEGTRTKDTNVASLRNGIFKVSQRAEAPIAVAIVDNVFRVKKRFPFKSTKILVKICDIIPYEQVKDIHTNEIGDKVKKIMDEGLLEARKNNEWIGK